LPRKTRYKLLQRNKLGIKIFGTPNAWIDSDIMISWLDEIFFPYVGENKSILILDSYAAHYSKEVRTHLTKNPNVKLALIPGGLTPILQPLDYTINASFKRYIKEKSQKHQTVGARENVKQSSSLENEGRIGKENVMVPEKQFLISKTDRERAVNP